MGTDEVKAEGTGPQEGYCLVGTGKPPPGTGTAVQGQTFRARFEPEGASASPEFFVHSPARTAGPRTGGGARLLFLDARRHGQSDSKLIGTGEKLEPRWKIFHPKPHRRPPSGSWGDIVSWVEEGRRRAIRHGRKDARTRHERAIAAKGAALPDLKRIRAEGQTGSQHIRTWRASHCGAGP